MKKRIISLLLAVFCIVSLFSCLSVTAYASNAADFEWIEHTVSKGQTVSSICGKYGIVFDANKDLIKSVNNLDSKFSIQPNQILYLPKSGVDYSGYSATATPSGTKAAAQTATATQTATQTAAAPAAKSNIPAGDVPYYYIISYVMKAGDTVYEVCRGLGISFNSFSETIKSLNGISKYTNISAGTTLLLPANCATASTPGAVQVMAHKIANGETASSIAKLYGLDYSAVAGDFLRVNPGTSLDKIKAGDVFYVPVAMAATKTTAAATTATATASGAAVTTVSTGTAAQATTTAATATASTQSGGSIIPAAASGSSKVATHSIKIAKTSNGSVSATVNGKAVTSAAVGTAVSIVTNPNSGSSVTQIVVAKSNGGRINVAENTFIMPDYDVTITVTFGSGHEIDVTYVGNGQAGATVNGKSCYYAKKGENVSIITIADKDWFAKSVNVYLTGTNTQIAFSKGSFVMPDADVTVKVTFEKAAGTTYYIKREFAGGFDYNTMVNGINTDMAKPGDVVKVYPIDGSGLEISYLSYEVWNKKLVYKTEKGVSSFVMPESDVIVNAFFRDKNSYNITVSSGKGGSVSAQINGSDVTSAYEGTLVTAVPVAKSGYRVSKVTYTANGSTYDITSALKFTMPEGKVKLEAEFEKVPVYAINVNFDSTKGKAEAYVGDENVKEAGAGELVDLLLEPKAGFIVKSINITDDSTGANLGGYIPNTSTFFMPAGSVTVDVTFATGKLNVDTAYAAHGWYGPQQDGKLIDEAENGSTVYVYAAPDEGYELDKVWMTYNDGKNEQEVDLSVNLNAERNLTYFTMRPYEVVVHATFKAKGYGVDISGCALNAANVYVNGDVADDIASIPHGSTVTLAPVISGATYSLKVVKDGDSSVVLASGSNGVVSFMMPAYNVKVLMNVTPNTLTLKENYSEFGNFDMSFISFNDVKGTAGEMSRNVTPGTWLSVEPRYYESGFYYELTVTRDSDGAVLASTLDKPTAFEMPAYSITISVVYKPAE